MKSNNGISIVIPTFRREKQVLQILNSLKNQKDQKLDLEIIICDSFSNYNLSNLKKYQKHLKISYYNIKKIIYLRKEILELTFALTKILY